MKDYTPTTLEEKDRETVLQRGNAISAYRIQQAAQTVLRSKEYKQAVKELKRNKMNTPANRAILLSNMVNASRPRWGWSS